MRQERGISGLPCAQHNDGVHCTITAELGSVLCMPATAFEVLSAPEPVPGGEGHPSSPRQVGKSSASLSLLTVLFPSLWQLASQSLTGEVTSMIPTLKKAKPKQKALRW